MPVLQQAYSIKTLFDEKRKRHSLKAM